MVAFLVGGDVRRVQSAWGSASLRIQPKSLGVFMTDHTDCWEYFARIFKGIKITKSWIRDVAQL